VAFGDPRQFGMGQHVVVGVFANCQSLIAADVKDVGVSNAGTATSVIDPSE
jgi:hypothetical protein